MRRFLYLWPCLLLLLAACSRSAPAGAPAAGNTDGTVKTIFPDSGASAEVKLQNVSYLTDAQGEEHVMAGLLDLRTSFAHRKMNLGYRRARLLADGPLGPAGTVLAGHEFHYSTVVDRGADEPFAMAADAYGSAPAATGSRRGNVTGSFFHAIARVG